MGVVGYLKSKHLERWLGDYGRHLVEQVLGARQRAAAHGPGPTHVLFAFCDHWEPLFEGASDARGDERVRAWTEGYPALASQFQDADGRSPQHSFFFPGEQYRPRWMDALGDLSKRGFGEVELHLHHDGDTRESLRRDILTYLEQMGSHGHFSRDDKGAIRYAFIHGNWCLANARSDGRYCGVDDEIPLLWETGCYADFTFPAPDSEAQPNVVNQIYWPTGNLAARRAHENAERARVGERKSDRLLIVTGPSAIGLRKNKIPLFIENSAVTAREPGTRVRVRRWVTQGICVQGRPEWVFVKIHTHGAPEAQAAAILGDAGRAMHEELKRYNDGERYALHYVTAREMFNVALAAMDGKSGNPNEYRDYVLAPPPVRATRASQRPASGFATSSNARPPRQA